MQIVKHLATRIAGIYKLRLLLPKRAVIAYYEWSLRGSEVDPTLRAMLDHFRISKLYDKTSRMWVHLLYIHVQRLASGISIQEITKNYCLRFASLDKVSPALRIRSELPTDPHKAVAMIMRNYIYEQFGDSAIAAKTMTPSGLDHAVEIDGKLYSQDSLQSIIEVEWVKRDVSLNHAVVLEIGAGYGRLASALFSGGVRQYVIVDIPPALHVSQSFLRTTFPERRIFQFRPFNSFDKVRDEMVKAEIVFLMPDQLRLLPDGMIDLSIGINCFQEMLLEQVVDYLNQFDRLSRYVYLKAMDTPHNVYKEMLLPFDQYPINPSWRQVKSEPCMLPIGYTSTLYECRPSTELSTNN